MNPLDILKAYRGLATAIAVLIAAGGLFAWHLVDRHEAMLEAKAEVHGEWDAANVKAKAEAVVTEETWKANYKELHRASEIQLGNIAAVRDLALDELRKRAPRRADLPDYPRAACAGATGAELSGPDGGFLAREAARADGLRVALGECQAREAAIAARGKQ